METGSNFLLQIPPPWTLSPVKSNASCEKNFLEMSFPEEEDDDEYHPSKEELEVKQLYAVYIILLFCCIFYGSYLKIRMFINFIIFNLTVSLVHRFDSFYCHFNSFHCNFHFLHHLFFLLSFHIPI